MKPLGDRGFIKLVRTLIAAIVFIAHSGAMEDVGRIGLEAFVCVEVVFSLAPAIGLVFRPSWLPG